MKEQEEGRVEKQEGGRGKKNHEVEAAKKKDAFFTQVARSSDINVVSDRDQTSVNIYGLTVHL